MRRFAILLMIGSALLSLDAHAQGLSIQQVAPGVYVHFGRQEEASEHNHGDISNIGFVVGERGVGVIDTGGSPEEGLDLLAAIRSVTPLPVLFVINTHVHPDHIFGNTAFQDTGATFVGHAGLASAMVARGAFYLGRLPVDIGKAAAMGAKVISPSLAVDGSVPLDLGGRQLMVQAWPTAHTDNDISIYDSQTQTLWTGDLVFRKRIPVVDGSLVGWLGVMDRLAAIPAKLAVPGHGPLITRWPDEMDAQRHYLMVVRDGVRDVIKAHGTMEQAMDKVGQSERDNWLLFDHYHRRNVSAAFAELEWE